MTQLTPRAIMVRLGFSQDADDKIFNGQGIDLIDEWLNLDDHYVKALIQNVRKPGGGGQGEIINFKVEMKLHLTVFLVCHKHRTSRSVDYSDITVQNMSYLKKQRDLESAKETNPETPTIDLRDVSRTYESMIQYLHGIRGCDGAPQSYVAQPTRYLMPNCRVRQFKKSLCY